jgi:phosphoribosylformylglycinamidine synthase
LAIALAESCISGQLGALIHLNLDELSPMRHDRLLFGEGGARILVSVKPTDQVEWEGYLSQHLETHWEKIGTVTPIDTGLEIQTSHNLSLIRVKIETMIEAWSQAIENRLAKS